MAYFYVPVERDQLFLLPPDMAEWLPEDHLAWFVIDVVDALDLSAFHVSYSRGAGRAAYHPAMMLGLLVYAYCCGVRSSRKIEALCHTDAAFRVLCGGHRPDHATIARFRRAHEDQMAELFIQILELCRDAGMAAVGTVALDGTRVAGNASKGANRSESWLRAEVEQMMSEAERIDADEDARFGDARGDEVPSTWGPRGADRVRRLQECLDQIDGDRQQRQERGRGRMSPEERAAREDRAAAEGRRLPGRRPRGQVPDPVREAEREAARARAGQQKRAARRADLEARRAAEGRRARGPAPDDALWARRVADAEEAAVRARAQPPPPTEAAPDTATDPDREPVGNVTDPDSRLQKTSGGWLQGYNAQAMVSEDQVIVAADVTNCSADTTQFAPMVDQTLDNLARVGVTDPIGVVLADAGYCSEDNLTHPGPDRLISTQKEHRQRKTSGDEVLPEPPEDASALDKMRHRLSTKEDAERYKRRSVIVEPVFGQNKQDRGFRQFSRRGLSAVTAEWQLVCSCHNLLKLFTATRAGTDPVT
jgi:transposase